MPSLIDGMMEYILSAKFTIKFPECIGFRSAVVVVYVASPIPDSYNNNNNNNNVNNSF